MVSYVNLLFALKHFYTVEIPLSRIQGNNRKNSDLLVCLMMNCIENGGNCKIASGLLGYDVVHIVIKDLSGHGIVRR
jgi:hypothetical protein